MDFYKDTGVLGFYLGTDLRNKEKAIDRLFSELDFLIKEALNTDIVDILKEQLKGRFFLSQESTFKRMTRLAKNEIYFGNYIDDNRIVKMINKISPESLYGISRKFLRPECFSKVIISPGKN
jgi:predicted Zn-dependent peptidase